eukprot:jgi/Chlat1/8324/Chrsp8S08093
MEGGGGAGGAVEEEGAAARSRTYKRLSVAQSKLEELEAALANGGGGGDNVISNGETFDSDQEDDKPLAQRLPSAKAEAPAAEHGKLQVADSKGGSDKEQVKEGEEEENAKEEKHEEEDVVEETQPDENDESNGQQQSAPSSAAENGSDQLKHAPTKYDAGGEVKKETKVEETKVKLQPAPHSSDSEDDVPLSKRQVKAEVKSSKAAPSSKAAKPEANGSARKAPPYKRKTIVSESEESEDESHEADDESEDDVPLAKRANTAAPKPSKPESHGSIAQKRIAEKLADKRKPEKPPAKKAKQVVKRSRDKEEEKPRKRKRRNESSDTEPVSGKGEKKWTTLEHNGVLFPPPYTPHGIKMLYKGQPVDLAPEQEEMATFFAVMKDTDYMNKPTFIKNFWHDFKKLLGPKHVIQDLNDCDFTPIYDWHLKEKERKKNMTTEEKKRIKEEKLKAEEKYMFALVDGHKEKLGNFRVEPPGLFRGRGEHPKMGKYKRRVYPEEITLNMGPGAPVPPCPMEGHNWKSVRHDNTVTWLAYWKDPVNPKEVKYVWLAASSALKGQSDKDKYEKARKLKDYIHDIRRTYEKNFGSKDATQRQIAVATYLIDKLALRAGNEKDDDEADTVGCCSLRVENVKLVPPSSIELDFLGKDSMRYFNTVVVDDRVYKAIGDFIKGKKKDEDLFDKLDTTRLNLHLKGIMPGLTAKVFRTYNASITLDEQLLTTDAPTLNEKVAAYQRANKEVAILCNHQRSAPKAHGAQMEKLQDKLKELNELRKELETELKAARKGNAKGKANPDSLNTKIKKLDERIQKMSVDMRVKEEMKTVALGTSKINYMDPRITVAWCKRHEVPIEKVFNKSLLAKFTWAMDVEPEYRF